MKMSVERCWSDTDRGKPKYWEMNLSLFHLVYLKSQMDFPGIEGRPGAA
jgi:hypothetical protein